jgi:predicted transcriptional regulator
MKLKLTERDLNRIVRRVISEETSDTESLYSEINKLIDGSYSEMNPSDVADVLRNILDSYEAMSRRKKRGMGGITKDDVMKRFR